MHIPSFLHLLKGPDAGSVPPQFLVLAANGEQDRYHLFDEPQLPTPDLDNLIHPIFKPSNFRNTSPSLYRNLRHSLRFASNFLESEPMLEWFIRPIFGKPLLDSATGKTFLSNPAKCALRKKVLTREVRRAFACLAHSIHFEFLDTSEFFASTTQEDQRPAHTGRCTPAFASKGSVRIRIRGQYRDYLSRDYATAGFSDNLRFDFHLALTLVHEIAHAVGVMRRDDLKEPNIDLGDPPKTEHGQSWEHFAIGGIINPFDRISRHISFVTWRKWSNNRQKDYTTIPMSWIAQWFQKSTWRSIQKSGPKAVAPPPVHLVLRFQKDGFTVIADRSSSLDDVQSMKRRLATALRLMPGYRPPNEVYSVLHAKTASLSDVPDAGCRPQPTASSLKPSEVLRIVSKVLPKPLQKVPAAQENTVASRIPAYSSPPTPRTQTVLARSALASSSPSKKRKFSDDATDSDMATSPRKKRMRSAY